MNYRFTAYKALLHLKEALNKYPNHNLLNEINMLIEQVQERKFIVAVAGEFNRGKSSLINALLGLPILPMDILPMTATVNRIVYGLTPRVCIQMRDGSKMQIKINELAEYVTKQTDESREIARSIQETVIEYPTIICQNGIEILDTPGLNDTEEMTKITKTVLQKVHAVVFAVSAIMPLSMSEVNWLAKMIESEQLQYLMFAVTFFDRVAEQDKEKVLETIRLRISTMIQNRVLELYPDRSELIEKAKRLTAPDTMFLMPVASRDALDAFELGDDELLQKSNLPQFKIELITALNAQQDEYAIRRTSELLHQVETWLQEEKNQRNKLEEAKQIFHNCDNALQYLEKYVSDVQQRINQVYDKMEFVVRNTPDAYSRMREAANAVIDEYKGKIQSNEDVHNTLRKATMAAREAARAHYLKQWQIGGCLTILNQCIEYIQEEHEELQKKCEMLLDCVPQLQDTESLKKKLWLMMTGKVVPELPETWSLDITGGVLKDMASSGQRMAEKVGRFMSTATDYMEKKSPGFRKIKEDFDGFIRQNGFAEKVGNFKLSPMDVKEGLLTGRNLFVEIEPMLSKGTTSLIISWTKMPEIVGPILHQVYIGEERLQIDASLQLALTKRKGEADAMIWQYIQEYEERFENAWSCVEKAARALGETHLCPDWNGND